MGLTFSSLLNSFTSLVRWSKDQDVRILMLGLDSAGKVCWISWNRLVTSYLLHVHVDYDIVQVAGMISWTLRLAFLIILNQIGEVVSTIPSGYLVVWSVRLSDVFDSKLSDLMSRPWRYVNI